MKQLGTWTVNRGTVTIRKYKGRAPYQLDSRDTLILRASSNSKETVSMNPPKKRLNRFWL